MSGEKTRVLHVISDKNFGGAGRVLINLLKYGDKNRFEYAVALPKNSALIPETEKTGVKIYCLENMDDRSFAPKAVGELRKIFKDFGADIIHCHAAASAKIAARIFARRAKILYTRHSVFDVEESQKKKFRRFLYRTADRIFSDMCIAVSPAAKENLIELGADADRIEVVMNGAEGIEPAGAEEKRAAKLSLGIPPESFTVLMAARLVEIKGFRFAMDAFADGALENATLLIAGAGPMEDEIKARSETQKNIVFAGFRSETLPLYRAADIILSASYGTEATSMALIEAMSAGIPAAASRFGGNPFVVEDGVTGALFPPKNSDAIKNAVLKLERADLGEMKAACVKKFGEKFSASVMAANTETCYKKLLSRKEPAQRKLTNGG